QDIRKGSQGYWGWRVAGIHGSSPYDAPVNGGVSLDADQSLSAWLQWVAQLFKDSLAMTNRWRRTSEERQRLAVLDSTMSTVREQLANARTTGLDHLAGVYNVGLYLLLVDRVFSVVSIEMVSTFEGWPLRYTARHAALLLYEVCDDLTQMLGKDFRASL